MEHVKYNHGLKVAVFFIFTGSFLYAAFLILRLLMLDYPRSMSFAGRAFQSLLATMLWFSASIAVFRGKARNRKWYAQLALFVAANTALILYSGLATLPVSGFTVVYISTVLNMLIISDKTVPPIMWVLLTFLFNIPFVVTIYGAAALLPLLIVALAAASVSFIVKKELEWLYGQMKIFDQSRWAASEFVRVNMRMQDNVDRSEFYGRKSERKRLAREIHDSVGYTLTAVLLQIQAAQEVLKVDPDQAMMRLQDQEETLRTAMQDVRREVSNLRDFSEIERTGKHRWVRK